MKPKTKKWLKQMLYLIRIKKAFFYRDGKTMCYTYPKHGWVITPTLGTKTLLDFLDKADDQVFQTLVEQMRINPGAIEALYG